MKPAVRLADRIAERGGVDVRLEPAEVTAVSPVTVRWRGSDIEVPHLDSYIPTVGDVVAVVVQPPQVLIVGSIGAGSDLTPEDWHLIGATGEPAFTGGFVNFAGGGGFDTAGFYKEPTGVVRLKGLVTGTTANDIFTLPAGYRPAATRVFAVSSNSAFGRVDVRADGTVRYLTGASPGNVALDGISFRVA